MADEHFDVLIVGAGLSGIAAAYHLQTRCPGKTYAILEAREAIGGTWDLFRYPGVRSDSDMHTLGYGFRPWTGEKAITEGETIREYVRDTAREFGIDRHIRFGVKATRAEWSSAEARWALDTDAGRFTCSFLFLCTGYYDYAAGYLPDWPEMQHYRGALVHPQHWPEDLDYAGKRVVVIGSGATAVTLVPELARQAAHVTMLQRSPTYVVSRPAKDPLASWLHGKVPDQLAHTLVRWKFVLLGLYFYNVGRKHPAFVKRAILKLVRKELGPDYDLAHFTPRYNVWDQRLCLVPDSDLFRVLREGKAEVVTDSIERFTESGLQLASGRTLEADVVVTATGLKVKMVGGMQLVVDGAPVELPKTLTYKGMMLSDVPNLAFAFGYTNASWTLKVELTARYVCRLINYMDRHGYAACTPRRGEGVGEEPAVGFTSGYIQRAAAELPRQGSVKPWKLHQNYLLDLAALSFRSVQDEAMEFTPRKRAA